MKPQLLPSPPSSGHNHKYRPSTPHVTDLFHGRFPLSSVCSKNDILSPAALSARLFRLQKKGPYPRGYGQTLPFRLPFPRSVHRSILPKALHTREKNAFSTVHTEQAANPRNRCAYTADFFLLPPVNPYSAPFLSSIMFNTFSTP